MARFGEQLELDDGDVNSDVIGEYSGVIIDEPLKLEVSDSIDGELTPSIGENSYRIYAPCSLE